MRFLCIWSFEKIAPTTLLPVIPRVLIDRDVMWGDLQGMRVEKTIGAVHHLLGSRHAMTARMGVAQVPVSARIAARYCTGPVTYVEAGRERDFLAPLSVDVLEPSQRLANLFSGVGIETCGDLAAVTQESCEIRFGGEGVSLWRLARADDPRPLFPPIPRALPSASLEWTDYTLRRAERLLFVINNLCGNVCQALRARGEGAVMMTLRFSLANRSAYEHSVRAARATANQNAWMRLLRLELERIVLPDAVTGITLLVDTIGTLGGKQGDVFDLGFGTAQAAEEAIASVLDDQGAVVVEPATTRHPLLDRRTTWTSIDAAEAIERHTRRLMQRPKRDTSPVFDATQSNPTLTLQLLPAPVRITVGTVPSHGKEYPHTYRDGTGSHRVVDAAGPDRVAGDRWEQEYAREYYRCVNDDGMLVWMYRDVRTNAWYLHGWWD